MESLNPGMGLVGGRAYTDEEIKAQHAMQVAQMTEWRRQKALELAIGASGQAPADQIVDCAKKFQAFLAGE